jgi:predicted Zn-dependent peptidase
MPGVRSATLGFFFRSGSRHEPGDLNGISHFIEHTVFKGTERRSALDIAIEQDRLGGNLEAFTTHEETGFAIKVIDDQLPHAFDLLADMLANPRFDESELKSERQVIIEEMKMTEDSPEDLLGEIFSEAFFPGHPLGLNIAGTPETVNRFDSEITRRYHAETYRAANLVIAVAGNVEHAYVVELVNKYFDPKISGGHRAVEKDAPQPGSPIIIRNNANLEQAHVIIATPFVGARDERRYAADILANIIGGGSSSRLWQKIREERGLAYSVGASNATYLDCGVFSVFAGTSPEHAGEVTDITVEELRRIVRDGITADELDLAKQQAHYSILLSLEDSASRAASLAQCEMVYDRQIPVEETLQRIDSVTMDETVELGREFFRTELVAFAALGDLDGMSVDRDRLAI